MLLQEEREQVAEYGRAMVRRGLTNGTFGNVSVYNEAEGLFAVSPSGMDYFSITPADVAVLTLDGKQLDGGKPSSETELHRVLYRNRPGICAAVHTHSRFATLLSCLGWTIPPLHYLIAYAGREVRCTPYVPFGTAELAQAALAALGEERACLLGNHGLLACGPDVGFAMDTAEQTEFCAELYYRARLAGQPRLLTEDELTHAMQAVRAYRRT